MLEARWKTLKSSNLKRILRKKSRRNSRSYKKTRVTKRKQRGGSYTDSGTGKSMPFGSRDVPPGFGGAKVGLSDEGVPVVTGLD